MENTLSTVASQLSEGIGQAVSGAASYLPEGIDQAVSSAVSYLPKDISSVVKHAASYLPAEIDLMAAAQFMLYFAAASLILGVISRIVLGKRSSLNHSLSAAVGILFIYALTVVVYTFKPWNLHMFLSPLPFVTFSGEYLIVFPIADAQFPALCSEVLSMVILAFLVNLLDSLIPKGKTVIGWYLLRFIGVIAAMALHLGARWAFHTYLPGVLVTYAPTILLVLLVFMLLSGVLTLVLGLVIAISNPFLGAMYSFFFSNLVGKQLSKAVFSSAILCGIVYMLEYFGYTVICITAAALMAYIPLVLLLLVLWYIIGHVL